MIRVIFSFGKGLQGNACVNRRLELAEMLGIVWFNTNTDWII